VKGLIKLAGLLAVLAVVMLVLLPVVLAVFSYVPMPGVQRSLVWQGGLGGLGDAAFHRAQFAGGVGLVEAVVCLLILVVMGGFFLCLCIAAWRLLAGEPARSTERLGAEESRIMQEIYQGLARLETRVDSLETILLDRRAGRFERSGFELGN
jgi:hypothetical protein